MSNNSLQVIAQALAEQTYMNHLLTKRLVELEILKEGEIKAMADASPQDQAAFAADFLKHLVSIGLKIE